MRPLPWLVLLAALLGACLPPQASYRVGLGTTRVYGFIVTTPGQPPQDASLVVAYLYHHQFVNRADGSAVLLPTARVVQAGSQGDFALDVPTDVVRMDVLFIAPDHLTEVFRFQRQLGVGDIEYRAALQPMRDWRSHYYTYLSPQLENLILERRYRLEPAEQQLLGRWMQAQDARLAPKGSAGQASS